MKKLFLALSTAALIFGLGACTSKKSSSASGKTSTSTSGSQSQTSTGDQSSSSSSEQGGGGATGDKIYLALGTASTFWGDKLAYVGEGGGFFAYFFNAEPVGAAWPGTLMTEVSTGVYSVDKQAAEHLIFNVNAANGSWTGDTQTVDLDVPTDGKDLFTLNTANEGSKQNGEWSTYAA